VLNGLDATRQILADHPSARVLILSAHSGDEYLERFGELGAAGFLEKQTSAEVLVEAVLAVARGETFYSPSILRRQRIRRRAHRGRPDKSPPECRLTARETQVLQLVAEGLANKQIAGTLGISVKTVEKHRQQVMDKLGIHETAGLTRYALARGIVERGVRMTIL
jgi:DNA-binding NarL/FixJ family response regulator